MAGRLREQIHHEHAGPRRANPALAFSAVAATVSDKMAIAGHIQLFL